MARLVSMQPDALVNDNGDALEGEDVSRDDYREAEARREETARWERYMAAARLRSGEASGIGAAGIPDVPDAYEYRGPYHQRQTTQSTVGGLSRGVSPERRMTPELSESELQGDFSDHSSSGGIVVSPRNGRAGLAGIKEEHHEPVSGISQAAVSGAAIAAAGQNGGPNYNTPFAARGSPVAGARPSLGSDPRVLPGGHTPLMNGGPAGAPISSLSQRPSHKLSQATSGGAPASEDTNRRRSMSAVLSAANASGAGSARKGSMEGEVGEKSVLADLPQEHQMTLSFHHINSWVSVQSSFSKQDKTGLAKYAGAAKECFTPGDKKKKKGAEAEAGKGSSPTSPPGTPAPAGGRRGLPWTFFGWRTPGETKGQRDTAQEGQRDVETGEVGLNGPASGRKDPTTPPAATPPPAGPKQILHDISGHVKPGQVLALMGPSGSGKTSLLSILGGRAPKQVKTDGQVLVNGQRLTKAARRRIGFVLQDDVLYETLTVIETLTYAGLLRLPKKMSKAEKMGRVNAVIDSLGLTKSKDTIIGGYFRRGISGGERKRVSVGSELLINPSILMLDEPTSGLDSTTALHLVTLLRDLARGGRAILTTIHQPSSRLFRQLDQVMLLAEGHVMYMGDALLAADYFDHLGFRMPFGTNLADHLLDCATGEVTHDPTAPGVSQAAAAFGVATSPASGQQGSAQHDRRKLFSRKMHGAHAVKVLNTTFEAWVAQHPDGFAVPPEFREEYEKRQIPGGDPQETDGSGELDESGQPVTAPHPPAARTASTGMAPTGPLKDLLDSLQLAILPFPGCKVQPRLPPAGPVQAPTSTPVPDEVPPPANQNGGLGGRVKGAFGVLNPLHKRVTKAADAAHAPHVHIDASGASASSSTAEERPDPALMAGKRDGASYMQQVSILWQRAVKVRRFESLSGQNLIQMVAIAVITGLLWLQRGQQSDIAGGADITGLLFFELLFPSFRSLFSALFTFPNEFRMLSKERPSGMYKLSAYYIARTGADLPVELLYPTIFVIIIYFLGGLRYAAGAFFANLASILLVVLVAQTWGLLVGGVFMDPKTAQTVTTVLMLTLMLVGGYYVRNVPVWISWLKYLSFIYYGFNLLLKIEFRGMGLTNCGAATAGGECPVVTGSGLQSALSLTTNPNDSVWPEVVALLGWLILLRWLTYETLRWRTASNQKNL